MARRHRARGFTLVEVLVALAAMAVLASLAWRGVDGMLRTREATQRSIERTTRLHTVFTQLRQDLESLVDEASSQATPAAWNYDGRTLRLVRTDGEALRVVAWSRIDGSWMRWVSPPVTRIGALQEQWLRSLQLQGREPEQVVLLEGVESVELYCRGQDGNRFNCQSTGDLVQRGGSAPVPPAGAESPPSGASGDGSGQPSGGTGTGTGAGAPGSAAPQGPAAVRSVVPRVFEFQLTVGGARIQRLIATGVRG